MKKTIILSATLLTFTLSSYSQSDTNTIKTIVWSIILILLLALGILFTQFKKSFTDTKDARKKQLDAESELEEYKKLALEREQKIRRQLQDELNKNKRN